MIYPISQTCCTLATDCRMHCVVIIKEDALCLASRITRVMRIYVLGKSVDFTRGDDRVTRDRKSSDTHSILLFKSHTVHRLPGSHKHQWSAQSSQTLSATSTSRSFIIPNFRTIERWRVSIEKMEHPGLRCVTSRRETRIPIQRSYLPV